MRLKNNNYENYSSDTKQQQPGDRQSLNSEAVFLGWQETSSGTVALFNVIKKDHPLYHSTVAEDTLRMYNLKIPQVP